MIMDLIDFIMHIDVHLSALLVTYKEWIYAILFAIIFIETGIVIMPFLPGDSLLFAAGMLAAAHPDKLNVVYILILLFTAGVLGDACNYAIGKYFGMKFLNIRLFGRQMVKPQHIDKTNEFYEKYGPATIIIARFVPIVRTLAPFVGGVGKMSYGKFLTYNVLGAALWVGSMTLAGYFLGNIPIIKDNFSKVVLIIIFLSILPIIYQFIKEKFFKKNQQAS